MIPINTNITSFTEHLENNIPISCSKAGWKRMGCVERFMDRIFSRLNQYRDSRLESIGKCFLSAMDTLERCPVEFNSEIILQNQQSYAEYLKSSKVVKKLLFTSKSKKIHSLLNDLAVKTVALKYRIEGENGGLNPDIKIDGMIYNQVVGLALKWKQTQPLYLNPVLTQNNLDKITEACSFPKFTKLLLRDSKLQDAFFKWALRDNNGVSQFVQFPFVCNRLKNSFIAARLNNYHGDALTIAKIEKAGSILKLDTREKVLQLPFYNGIKAVKINILDESREVTLNRGWKLTIKNIFEIFANKNKQPGYLEFLGVNGITNWSICDLGEWDPHTNSISHIDLSDSDWLSKLPFCRIKSLEEIKELYGITHISDWLFVYHATRESDDLSLSKRHSFVEIIKPLNNGQYAIYPFGEYPEDFPEGIFASIAEVDATSYAYIQYPDENINYPHRQHAVFAEQISSENGLKILESIKQDVLRAQTNNLIIQPRNENCSFWSQKIGQKVENTAPINPFKIKIIQSDTFSFIGRLPARVQPIFIAALDFLLCSFRGKTVKEDGKDVFKSISAMPKHEKPFIYQPGWLHQQIKVGDLQGKIYYGHC